MGTRSIRIFDVVFVCNNVCCYPNAQASLDHSQAGFSVFNSIFYGYRNIYLQLSEYPRTSIVHESVSHCSVGFLEVITLTSIRSDFHEVMMRVEKLSLPISFSSAVASRECAISAIRLHSALCFPLFDCTHIAVSTV